MSTPTPPKAAWDPSTPNAGDYARAAWAAQPPAKPKRRWLRAILIFVAGLVLGGLSGHSTGSAPAAVAPQPAAVVAPAPAPAAPEPAAPEPAAPAAAAPAPAAPAPAPAPAAQPAPAPASACDPNYSGCVPIASDVDCAGGQGNGPAYVRGPVVVTGSDIYGLDADDDAVGCES